MDLLKLTASGRDAASIGPPQRKRAFEHAQNAQIQAVLRMRKVSSGHAQADPGLRCPQMPEDMFSQGTAKLSTQNLVNIADSITFSCVTPV